jgi:hypothetical protein|nr:MAG TPA: hypothetical protein [Caudoviricetes sp.]
MKNLIKNLSYLSKETQKKVKKQEENHMKYCIETTDNGCIETLEMSKNEKFQKKSTKTEYGCTSSDPDFSDQLEEAGYCDEIVEKVYDLYDGCETLDFIQLAELVNK